MVEYTPNRILYEVLTFKQNFPEAVLVAPRAARGRATAELPGPASLGVAPASLFAFSLEGGGGQG